MLLPHPMTDVSTTFHDLSNGWGDYKSMYSNPPQKKKNSTILQSRS